MKKLILIIFLFIAKASIAQHVSVFHRLLIYNEANEVMLVKVKGPEIWVTPGFYQDSTQFIKTGLHEVAATYGIEISDPQLKGVFSMKMPEKEMKIRNIYKANYISGDIHFPENQPFTINEIKWTTLEEALELLSHDSVKLFLKQTHNNPNQVSGGSILVDEETKIVEEFYSLFN